MLAITLTLRTTLFLANGRKQASKRGRWTKEQSVLRQRQKSSVLARLRAHLRDEARSRAGGAGRDAVFGVCTIEPCSPRRAR
ncbi:hypothetical protein D7S44_06640 [Pantoea piersonii]|nr:hypothetical protein D7S44_06640 [Pantoea piersonii]